MRRIIIYYSQGGTTDLIAKTLAKNLNADLVRIHDLKNREGFKNRLLAGESYPIYLFQCIQRNKN